MGDARNRTIEQKKKGKGWIGRNGRIEGKCRKKGWRDGKYVSRFT
jgi:hypothetical protein